ncbi:hypothetical protein DFH06DRAFT_1253796 [Mycena polygramma]|nr:hypothetical protein DFH06DRAFT_1253796 [Mycena polygramma]
MFILPAHAHPFDLVAPAALSHGPHSWAWASSVRLALALLATLTLLLLVRSVLRAFVLPKVFSSSSSSSSASPPRPRISTRTLPPAPAKRTSWLGLFSWETLPLPVPAVSASDLTIPIALNAVPPPAMRGRHVYRGGRGVGFAAPRARANIEAPLPAIYESQTPVSMAKMIMSRHTYRRPTPPSPAPAPAPKRSASAPSPASSSSAAGRRPPSPPTEGNARSASL